jgi:hypothetical protein
MKQSREELEYSISQYIDGTLPLLDRNALEERLAVDAEARGILAEYQKLDNTLKRAMPRLPAIAWDRLAGEIQQAVAAVEDPPVRHYSIRSLVTATSWTHRLAIAALLLLGVAITTFILNNSNPGTTTPRQASGTLVVVGPQPQQASQPAIVQLEIGPSPELANQDWRINEEFISRPTVVLIDRAAPSGQDSDSFLQ